MKSGMALLNPNKLEYVINNPTVRFDNQTNSKYLCLTYHWHCRFLQVKKKILSDYLWTLHSFTRNRPRGKITWYHLKIPRRTALLALGMPYFTNFKKSDKYPTNQNFVRTIIQTTQSQPFGEDIQWWNPLSFWYLEVSMSTLVPTRWIWAQVFSLIFP